MVVLHLANLTINGLAIVGPVCHVLTTTLEYQSSFMIYLMIQLRNVIISYYVLYIKEH